MENSVFVSRILRTCFCLLLASLASASDHVAQFSMDGVSGTVSFISLPGSMGVSIQVMPLTGLTKGQDYAWNIRSLPMLYDRGDKCATEYIGTVYRNLTTEVGYLTNVTTGSSYTDTSLRLEGSDSVSGRTLAIEVDGTAMYCASILPVDDVITAVAQFGTPFAGTVTFRQRVSDPNAETSIFVDVFDVTEPIVDEEFDWHISDNTGIDRDMTLDEWCTATADDPYAAIGDLTPKFGSVTVKTVNYRERYLYVDTDITLSGEDSILDKSLVFTFGSGSIDGAGTEAACSPIRLLEQKTVFAEINNNNVTGNITFSQVSPWEPTTIEVSFHNLKQMAGGYHVHKFPVPLRIFESDFRGSADMVSGHFNPYNIDTSTDPNFPNGTHDQYEIGDISSKFGTLDGLEEYVDVLSDWNLPLFGENSIVGRSIIIHLANGDRWAYGQITYPKPVRTITAIFTYPLVGQITFRQDMDDPYSDTSVFLDLAHSDGSDTTVDHDWHIHIAKLGDDHLDQTGRCSSTLGHFNPFNVKLTEEYATECDIDVTRRCEIGDFSKKYGRIVVPGSVRTQAGKYFFTDVQLPLSGIYTIADRSVVVHVKDGAPERLGCGDTLEVFQAKTTASTWTGTSITGTVSLSQDSEFDLVIIDADLEGLGGIIAPWHTHVLPVPYDSDSPCSGESVQGHYNPFNSVVSPAVATVDYYEVGDFSGKFDYWDGLQEVDNSYTDPSASLFGSRNLVGRSIVVHLEEDGSRYSCATLEPYVGDGDFRIEGQANIVTDSFSGYLIVGQTRFSNGRMSETTIEAYFAPRDSSPAVDTYDWSIRTGNVIDGTCDNSEVTFNPNTVSTDGDYDTQCSIAVQLRCQVGDLTGKIGQYDSLNGRALLTDTNLPLIGTSGILGRPLYLESTSGDSSGCAAVLPLPSTGVSAVLTFPQMIDFDVYAFKQSLADSLTDVESWQIVAPHYPVISDDLEMCMDLALWIIGENAQAAVTELQEKAANDELGLYSPTDRCREGGTGAATQVVPTITALVTLITVLASIWQCVMTS